MTFTNTQTKLGQAITTNDSGDYAVRTIIEGDQTLGNLAVGGTLGVTGLTSLDGGLGADVDAKGKYLLNEQTTTNMMSKGTVYRFGDNQVIEVDDSDNLDFGTGDFGVNIKFKYGGQHPAIFQNLLYKGSGGGTAGFSINIENATDDLKFKISDGTAISSTAYVLTDGVEYDFFIAVIGGVSASGYINGILYTTLDLSTIGSVTNAQAMFIGGRTLLTEEFYGDMSFVGLTNFAPTAAEVKDLISGNIPFKWQYGSQTAQTSGTLEIGQAYIIDDWITADDFTNVGGLNVDGTIFVATGTTPTTWANSSSLKPLGAVALYDQTSISETTWYDKANGNNGAVTGASVLNQPVNDEHKGIIVNGGFLNIGTSTELTISGGVVTATGSFHNIDTEADAASDDLDTINGGKDGDILVLTAASSSRTVVYKDNSGNMSLVGDFSADLASDTLVLIYLGGWREISRSDNG